MSGYGKHSERPDRGHRTFITTTEGMSGHFAVMMWWAPEHGGFWEPWTTGIGRYETREEAEEEARAWAQAEGLEFSMEFK